MENFTKNSMEKIALSKRLYRYGIIMNLIGVFAITFGMLRITGVTEWSCWTLFIVTIFPAKVFVIWVIVDLICHQVMEFVRRRRNDKTV